jgi:hypothetical protein
MVLEPNTCLVFHTKAHERGLGQIQMEVLEAWWHGWKHHILVTKHIKVMYYMYYKI